MVAFTTNPTANSASPTPLSPLDRSLLTRLYNLPSLTALFDSLQAEPLPGAPATRFDLTEWALRPDIKPWIDAHETQLRDADQREMIALLKDIARTSDNQVERRRAATTVLRNLSGAPRGTTQHPPSRRKGHAETAPRLLHTSPQPPVRTPEPPIPDHPQRNLGLSPPKVAPELLIRAAGAATLEPQDLARLAMRLSLLRYQPEYLDALRTLLIPHATLENKPFSNLFLEVPVFHPNGAMFFRNYGQPTPTFRQIRVIAAQPPHQIISFIRYPNPTDPWRISDISTDSNPSCSPDSS